MLGRKCFALYLLRGGNGGALNILFYIEGSLLVAVLVAHILLLMKFRFSVRGSDRRLLCFHRGRPEPCCRSLVGNHAVVSGGVFEGFNREIETGVEGQRTVVGIHLFNNRRRSRCSSQR